MNSGPPWKPALGLHQIADILSKQEWMIWKHLVKWGKVLSLKGMYNSGRLLWSTNSFIFLFINSNKHWVKTYPVLNIGRSKQEVWKQQPWSLSWRRTKGLMDSKWEVILENMKEGVQRGMQKICLDGHH